MSLGMRSLDMTPQGWWALIICCSCEVLLDPPADPWCNGSPPDDDTAAATADGPSAATPGHIPCGCGGHGNEAYGCDTWYRPYPAALANSAAALSAALFLSIRLMLLTDGAVPFVHTPANIICKKKSPFRQTIIIIFIISESCTWCMVCSESQWFSTASQW